MKHPYMRMNNKWLIAAIIPLAAVGLALTPQNKFFEISKNIEIFANMYKELNTYYVDPIQPDDIMKTGIDAMMQSLDPYTQYIPAEQAANYQDQITGQYGGVGVLVRFVDGRHIVEDVYENGPAQRAGIMIGDIIVSIDGVKPDPKKGDAGTASLKGAAGTILALKIRRSGEGEKSLSIVREEIKLPNVPYYTVLDGKVGYIYVSSFTEKVALNVETALAELERRSNGLNGIILDLRNNGGGLLTEAVNLANIFLSKGVTVVSTKGKIPEWERTFKTLNSPADDKRPLVVLINGNTASASEIVAGALQDLDRAVLIGNRSYGKGLVQNTRDVGYGAKIKLTTAKYYTPSGRCIQAIDYQNGKPKYVSDSLKTAFKTLSGRTVYDGGGIMPDIVVEKPESATPILKTLLDKMAIFDYATQFRQKHGSIAAAAEFKISDNDFKDFAAFIGSKNYTFETESEKALKELEDKAKSEEFDTDVMTDINTIRQQIQAEKKNDIQRHKSKILPFIQSEVVRRYYGRRGAMENALSTDKDISEALSIINDAPRYRKTLNKTN